MMVGGQGFREAALPHQEKADGIAQGIRFIETCLQERMRHTMLRFINPDNFGERVVKDFRNKCQRACAWSAPRVG